MSVKEAIDLHLEGVVEDGVELPVRRAIGEHLANPDFAKGVWATVDVNLARFDVSAEKVNITLPRRLLAKIDGYAKAHGETRSGIPGDAARLAMQRENA